MALNGNTRREHENTRSVFFCGSDTHWKEKCGGEIFQQRNKTRIQKLIIVLYTLVVLTIFSSTRAMTMCFAAM